MEQAAPRGSQRQRTQRRTSNPRVLEVYKANNIMCDVHHRHPESLGHVMQRCFDTWRARTNCHNRVLDCHYQGGSGRLPRLKNTVIMTRRGNRIPNIVACKADVGSWVLCVQVVAAAAAGILQHRGHTYPTGSMREQDSIQPSPPSRRAGGESWTSPRKICG
ncbi:hypothetical protein GWK47_016664 [Chionoecetes opilio]|uniref:Uncharacterized protein n=1 Tax=Chionoecetes opilio TaxID=41210 RepID=A0A8J4XT77_CHIOP|nr:hypothetical protein GWK47_016664 [Chionoecetes opilio]